MLIKTKFAVKCHNFILFHKYNKYKFIFRKLHCFSSKMFRRCLTFDAVYILDSLYPGEEISSEHDDERSLTK